jgi:hypothetical protein
MLVVGELSGMVAADGTGRRSCITGWLIAYWRLS